MREKNLSMHNIRYNRKSLATGIANELEILYWSPTDAGEKDIYDAMTKTYDEIHTYKDEDFYGKKYEPTDQVLVFHTERKKDILQPFAIV